MSENVMTNNSLQPVTPKNTEKTEKLHKKKVVLLWNINNFAFCSHFNQKNHCKSKKYVLL